MLELDTVCPIWAFFQLAYHCPWISFHLLIFFLGFFCMPSCFLLHLPFPYLAYFSFPFLFLFLFFFMFCLLVCPVPAIQHIYKSGLCCCLLLLNCPWNIDINIFWPFCCLFHLFMRSNWTTSPMKSCWYAWRIRRGWGWWWSLRYRCIPNMLSSFVYKYGKQGQLSDRFVINIPNMTGWTSTGG